MIAPEVNQTFAKRCIIVDGAQRSKGSFTFRCLPHVLSHTLHQPLVAKTLGFQDSGNLPGARREALQAWGYRGLCT